jgi:hypothetical protein
VWAHEIHHFYWKYYLFTVNLKDLTLNPKTLIHLKGHFLAGKEQITANTLLQKALDMVQIQSSLYLFQTTKE